MSSKGRMKLGQSLSLPTGYWGRGPEIVFHSDHMNISGLHMYVIAKIMALLACTRASK